MCSNTVAPGAVTACLFRCFASRGLRLSSRLPPHSCCIPRGALVCRIHETTVWLRQYFSICFIVIRTAIIVFLWCESLISSPTRLWSTAMLYCLGTIRRTDWCWCCFCPTAMLGGNRPSTLILRLSKLFTCTIYVYICTYVYMYMYICIYWHMYTLICMCMCTCICICICICVCVCVCVSAYVDVDVCAYVYVYVSVLYTHTHIFICIQSNKQSIKQSINQPTNQPIKHTNKQTNKQHTHKQANIVLHCIALHYIHTQRKKHMYMHERVCIWLSA